MAQTRLSFQLYHFCRQMVADKLSRNEICTGICCFFGQIGSRDASGASWQFCYRPGCLPRVRSLHCLPGANRWSPQTQKCREVCGGDCCKLAAKVECKYETKGMCPTEEWSSRYAPRPINDSTLLQLFAVERHSNSSPRPRASPDAQCVRAVLGYRIQPRVSCADRISLWYAPLRT